MDIPQAPAFIPKKAVTPAPTRPRGGVGVVPFLATLLFFASLAYAGGLYAYTFYLGKQAVVKENSLTLEKKNFSPTTLVTYARLDAKLAAAGELLTRHTSVSGIFDTLEAHTLSSVRFKQFTFSAGRDKGTQVSMTGEADNYSAIALQSDAFGKVEGLHDLVFSNVNLDPAGRVSFQFTAAIDPALISYDKRITPAPAAEAAAPVVTPAETEVVSPVATSTSPSLTP